jgi:hypothetical protein
MAKLKFGPNLDRRYSLKFGNGYGGLALKMKLLRK